MQGNLSLYGVACVKIIREMNMKKIVVVVDVQRDFVDGALGTADAQRMVPVLLDKLWKESEAGTEFVFTMDTHGENYLETNEGKKLPVPHCIRGTAGWELIPELQEFIGQVKGSGGRVTVLEKPSFGSTELPILVGDADIIELTGLCTDICVISNAMILKAYYPEKGLQVDASCCAGVTPESHRNALEAMKACQIDVCKEEEKKLTIQAFGNFQVFVDGKAVHFSRSKSKELLAFLVDRHGAGMSTAEIAAILYEGKEYNRSVKNQVQTVISELNKALEAVGIRDCLIRSRNSLAVNIARLECDYYDFLEGKEGCRPFEGEYMTDYSWAEYTTGYLMRQIN